MHDAGTEATPANAVTGPDAAKRLSSGREIADEREWQRLVLAVLAFAFLAIIAGAAGAAENPLGDPGAGSMLIRSEAGVHSAPWLDTEVDIAVTGNVARVVVRQSFQNLTDEWVEGIYQFPLPGDAAVDQLRMQVDGRTIEGEVREREVARKKYQDARAAGQQAAVIEQRRPNLFSAAVANIGPRAAITVEIAYLQSIPFTDGAFRVRFPMTATPRHEPGQPSTVVAAVVGAEATATLRHAVLAPEEDYRSLASVRLLLDPGFALENIISPSHAIVVAPHDGRQQVVLADGKVPMDRDFQLEYRPAGGTQPAAAVHSETVDGKTYALLLFVPQPPVLTAAVPRETIFVIDTSGSMHGASLQQARAAVALAIQRLRPGDRFNLIRFSDEVSQLYALPVSVDTGSRRQALNWLAGLAADGGTNMGPALAAAFDPPAPAGFLRQVVFVTDGAVGNEAELYTQIRQRLGTARLFTVGIGSAPNVHFMRKAASFGRGSHVLIASAGQVEERMRALFARIEHPALTDVQVDWPPGAEVWPERIPDLYSGEPVVVAARLPGGLPAGFNVQGMLGGGIWSEQLAARAAVPQAGIAALWARRKIAALEDAVRDGSQDPEQVRRSIVDLALRHSLVTRHTSLVAIDPGPVRPQDAALHSKAVPVLLPAGVGGPGFPATATPALLHLLIGVAFLLAAGGLLWLSPPASPGFPAGRRASRLPLG